MGAGEWVEHVCKREREKDSAAPSRFAGPRSRSQQACFPPEAEVT